MLFVLKRTPKPILLASGPNMELVFVCSFLPWYIIYFQISWFFLSLAIFIRSLFLLLQIQTNKKKMVCVPSGWEHLMVGPCSPMFPGLDSEIINAYVEKESLYVEANIPLVPWVTTMNRLPAPTPSSDCSEQIHRS